MSKYLFIKTDNNGTEPAGKLQAGLGSPVILADVAKEALEYPE